MGVRKARKITSMLLLASVAVFCSGFFFMAKDLDAGITASRIIGVVLIIGAGIFDYFKVRCPHCDFHLGELYGDFCPLCGKKLDENISPHKTGRKADRRNEKDI